MPDVKYQGPVEMTAMLDHTAGPFLADQEADLFKKERIVQVCQSDQMFEWVHALATILIMSEKVIIGGLTGSEQLRMWQNRIKILEKPP